MGNVDIFCEAISNLVNMATGLAVNVKETNGKKQFIVYMRPHLAHFVFKFDVQPLYEEFQKKGEDKKELERIAKEMVKFIDTNPFPFEENKKEINLDDLFFNIEPIQQYMPWVTIPIPFETEYVIVPYAELPISKVFLKKCGLTEKNLVNSAYKNAKDAGLRAVYIDEDGTQQDDIYNDDRRLLEVSPDIFSINDKSDPSGASLLFDIRVLDYIYQIVGDDFYIVFTRPVNAFILKASAYKNDDAKLLQKAFTIHDESEYLKNVYIYKRKENKLMIAD